MSKGEKQAQQEETARILLSENDTWKLIHPRLEEDIKLNTAKGNLTRKAAYIYQTEYGGGSNYGPKNLIEARRNLEEIGAYDEESQGFRVPLPDDLESHLDSLDGQVHHSGPSMCETGRKSLFESVRNAVDEMCEEGLREATTSKIAERADVDTRRVSRVMMRFEEKHGLERKNYRLFNSSNGTTWNIKYLNNEMS